MPPPLQHPRRHPKPILSLLLLLVLAHLAAAQNQTSPPATTNHTTFLSSYADGILHWGDTFTATFTSHYSSVNVSLWCQEADTPSAIHKLNETGPIAIPAPDERAVAIIGTPRTKPAFEIPSKGCFLVARSSDLREVYASESSRFSITEGQSRPSGGEGSGSGRVSVGGAWGVVIAVVAVCVSMGL